MPKKKAPLKGSAFTKFMNAAKARTKKSPAKKKAHLSAATFKKRMAAGKAAKAKGLRGLAIKGFSVLSSSYGPTRGIMKTKRKEEVCKPTLRLRAKQNMSYNRLCDAYSRMGDEYRALGNSAFGSPRGSAIRKQYQAVQKQYKEIGVSLFKLGRPRSDYGKQHTQTPSEWSRDYDRKRAARNAKIAYNEKMRNASLYRR